MSLARPTKEVEHKNLKTRLVSGFNNISTQQKIITVSFLIIPVTLLLVFSYYPMLRMVYYSFFNWDGISPNMDFVGLKNYINLFSDSRYFEVFPVSLYYLAGSFTQLGLALYFATLLSFKIRAKNFFKGILFFPYLMNGVAIGFIFLFFYRPEGTLDTIMQAFGLGDQVQLWLQNPNINNISLTFTSVWRYMGFNFIVFLGAIQSISSDIYEAADLDGANKWQRFRYIIFPNILPIIELNLILSVKGAISVFEIPYIMTQGSNGTKTFVIQTVDVAFKHGKFGLASAMSVVLLLIIVTVTLVQKYYFSRKERG